MRATLAAYKAVIEPISLIRVRAHGKLFIKGLHRNSKNTPATTIVDLCNRAETGVGPSIAAGNQG